MLEWLRCSNSITTVCSSMSTVEVLEQCHCSFGHDNSCCTISFVVGRKLPTQAVKSACFQYSCVVITFPALSECEVAV
jgi:hypothetical protein